MEVSFSSKSQSLTSSLSSFSLSPSSSLSPRFYNLLRKEFLGCSNHRKLRLEYSKRKCNKKLEYRIQSTRFTLRASLYSQPVVVIVAVATISALVFLNYTKNSTRQKKGSNKLSDRKDGNVVVHNHELSKNGEEIVNQSIRNEILEIKEAKVEIHVEEESKINNGNENGSIYKEGFVEYEKEFESNGSVVVATRVDSVVSTKEIESNSSVEPPLLKELSLEPLNFVVERQEFPPQVHKGEFVMEPELSQVMVESVSSAETTTYGKDVNGHIHKEEKSAKEVEEASESQVLSYATFIRESVREGLHTFYEESQSEMQSLPSLKEFKTIYPLISKERISSASSLLEPATTLSREDLLINGSHSKTESLQREVPISSTRGGSSRKRKNVSKDGRFLGDIGNGLPAPNGQREVIPQLNGVQIIGTGTCDLSDYSGAYNRLLRGGRLSGCIELLESMEQRGLLDMNKVYHARFFSCCKTQKAVKEAFRFTNLIQNPTLSTFNMLLSVCASAQDSEGAFQALKLVKKAGMKADCKLYTTLISTCGKSGKVDAMFEVFHEMVNAGIEPNVNTYGALIDGCARAGQVAKAFGAYGILRSKNVKPDRVVFNALITACGQSGAVDRAFDVLADMKSEATPIDPDHVTVGALIKTCAQAGQFERAQEVYKMIRKYKIKGTPEVYTIAVNSCTQKGDIDFALTVYDDMKKNEVIPDEMLLSALVTVAGRAGKIDVAFQILHEARIQGAKLGNVSYSSLMGACCNAKDWKKALELYEDMKATKVRPTVSALNALITALCDGDQLHMAVEVLDELKKVSVSPNIITYSVLLVASEKKDDLELASMLYSQSRSDGVVPNPVMFRCIIGLCLRRFEKAYALGEQILSFNSGNPQIENKWSSLAMSVYRESITSGNVPDIKVVAEVLGCLQFPHETSLRARLVENLGVSADASKCPNLYSLIDGFGEYDPRSFSLLEEAASLGVLPIVSFKRNPIIFDARNLQLHTAEVYLLTILRGLKHRLAAGAKLPNLTILLPVEKTQAVTPNGEKTIILVGRVGQALGAMLRRLGLRYQGNESYGKIRINGLFIKRWFQPKLDSPAFSGKTAEFSFSGFSGKQTEFSLSPSQMKLGKGIVDQQRSIRNSNFSSE
ncbi:hypothetical protein MKW94_006000 [Papaver nudicaule]|uniref:PROP1-like PPR domain-containing protein n=1 Tax=Papaver nudicaule TaxID=74823 RepID=A0AA41V2A4_PAPNU|nr:hypothetical protein [Papaver nudicaule]